VLVAFKFSDNLTVLSNTAVSAGNLLRGFRENVVGDRSDSLLIRPNVLTDGRNAHRCTVGRRNLVSKRLNKLVDLGLT